MGGHDNGWSIADETYLRTYEKCWEAFKEDCGANLLDYAWKGGEAPSEAQVKRSTATMERWLAPPEPAPVASTGYAETSYASPVSGGGGYYEGAATVACESSGNYADSSADGYGGGPQFDAQTWDRYGPSEYANPEDAPPAVQDAAAYSMPYDGWPNC